MNENPTVVVQSPISTDPLVSFDSATLTVKPNSVTPLEISFDMELSTDEFANISPQPDSAFVFVISEIPEEDNDEYVNCITPFNVYVDRINRLHVKDIPIGTVFSVCAKTAWLTPSDDEMPENSAIAFCTVTVAE